MSARYNKPIVFVDMDDTIVKFATGIHAVKEQYPTKDVDSHNEKWDDVPGIFSKMTPVPGAIDALHKLDKYYTVIIASTAPWANDSAWSDKVLWVQHYFANLDDPSATLYKRVTITHNKDLLRGAYLIDDRPNNGAQEFGQEEDQTWIRFGEKWANHEDQTDVCLDWDAVLKRLLPNHE
jgi:5'-nucleotidase